MAQTFSSWGLLQGLLMCCIAFTDAVLNDEGYSGAQVLNILETPHTMRLIRRRGLDVWSSNRTNVDVLVPGIKLRSVLKDLSFHNIPFDVKIDNLGAVIKEQRVDGLIRRRTTDGKLRFDTYQRLSSIHAYLDHLAKAYPQVASVGIIGYTYEKRPLKYIKISSGLRNAKAVFIDGGIHAREWVSPATVTYIIRELVENRASLPKDLLSVDFYILPVLNPDGYEYTHTTDRMWRKNRSPGRSCAGADLNRNFDFKFGGEGTSGSECSEIYRGKGPNSELESQALTKFLLTLKGSLKAYISFHSYGQYILVPYGYTMNAYAPEYEEMKRVADEAARAIRNKNGQQYTVGNTANTMYPAAGGSDDWTKYKVGAKYAYCIELADNGKYGFLLPAREILNTAQGAFEGVKVIASAAAKA